MIFIKQEDVGRACCFKSPGCGLGLVKKIWKYIARALSLGLHFLRGIAWEIGNVIAIDGDNTHTL